jgi:hypothetical protein
MPYLVQLPTDIAMIPPFPSFLTCISSFFTLYNTWCVLQLYVDDDDEIPPFPWELFASMWTIYLQVQDLNTYVPVPRLLRNLLQFDMFRYRHGRNVWTEVSSNPEFLWYITGETAARFESIVNLVSQADIRPIRIGGTMDRRCRVLLLFIWLRQYPTHSFLAGMFGISVKTVSAVIFHILPILHRILAPSQIVWHTPAYWQTLRNRFPEFPNVVAMIDGTIIRINRPKGPIQRLYYRRDKHCHFVNWMVVVDIDGYFVFGQSGFRGHLIDSACYDYINMPVLPAGLHILGDRGFPQRRPLLVPIRRGQRVPEHTRIQINR